MKQDDETEAERTRRLQLNGRYEVAVHKMQTAIAVLVTHNPKLATPKHVRVGIDSAMVNDEALARLLMKKGVFTEEEYVEAVVEAAEREAARDEAEVQKILGPDVHIE